jgi:CspA family cold shock protein
MRGRYLYLAVAAGVARVTARPKDQQWSLQGGSGEMATTGTVKWFSPKKGYGFITMEDGQEVFVHYSAIDGNGFRSLEQGERVQFEVSQGPKGLQAANVMRA